MKADLRIFIKEKLFQFRPHIMKKILLGMAGVRAKVRGGEAAQPFFARAAARKIKPLQRAFNPDIHGKRGIESVAKQQNAVGYLAAHAAQLHQFRARCGIIHFADGFQVE
jgi:hypothetical protein